MGVTRVCVPPGYVPALSKSELANLVRKSAGDRPTKWLCQEAWCQWLREALPGLVIVAFIIAFSACYVRNFSLALTYGERALRPNGVFLFTVLSHRSS